MLFASELSLCQFRVILERFELSRYRTSRASFACLDQCRVSFVYLCLTGPFCAGQPNRIKVSVIYFYFATWPSPLVCSIERLSLDFIKRQWALFPTSWVIQLGSQNFKRGSGSARTAKHPLGFQVIVITRHLLKRKLVALISVNRSLD